MNLVLACLLIRLAVAQESFPPESLEPVTVPLVSAAGANDGVEINPIVIATPDHDFSADGSIPISSSDQQKPVPIYQSQPVQNQPSPEQPVPIYEDIQHDGAIPTHANETHYESGGPVDEMDLSDEEYRRFHDHMHLFDEHHEHHDERDEIRHHDAGGLDEHNGIVEEWSEHMDDFIPDLLLTFKLPAKTEEFFYQSVGPIPTHIRGGYFVAGEETTEPVNFSIVDPKGNVAFKKNNSEGLFQYMTEMEGVYAMVVSNPAWTGERYVTFVVGTGNETTLRIEDVNNLNQNVMVVARMLRDVHAESQYLWSRQKNQLATIGKANSRVMWLSLFELLVCVTVVGFQVHFLKKLVSSKRIF